MTIRIIILTILLFAIPARADVLPDFGGDYVGMVTTQQNEHDYEQRKRNDAATWRDLEEMNRRAEDDLARQDMEMQMEDMRMQINKLREAR